MKCMVLDIAGEDAITFDDGQTVYERIQPELAAGREVVLDFTGVAVFASPFLNAAIGQLLKSINTDDLNRLLQIEKMNATGHEVLRRVIENAKKYYASKDYREAQASVLQHMGEGS